MSELIVKIPDSLKHSIEELAEKEGYSVSQFLASAAAEKLAVLMTIDYLKREAASGRREDFEHYLKKFLTSHRRKRISLIKSAIF